MHELSIAESIVEAVLQEKRRRGFQHVRKVGLRVGALSGVMVEALEFSFQAIVHGTELDGAELCVEYLPVKIRCKTCGNRQTLDDNLFLCPQCGSADVDILQGEELDIAYLEVEDSPEKQGS